ncbi:MAG: nuclear transport factor 2 family protein [Citricoccus sp.]|jgi:ketosteroid isomerase-like protein|nr:nuclear transport factor 2 family protein [Citricoccus sp. WCRC_4]
MNANTAFDLAGFTRATEERNAETLLGSYADDAEVTIVDRNHPPKSPQVLKGKDQIRPWLEDTYSRDMTHRVVDPVVGGDRVALTTLCRYPDGTNVWCACTADISGGLITRQNVVQVWDE